MDQDEVQDFLHNATKAAQRKQGEWDDFTRRAAEQGAKVQQEIQQRQMWHGEPPPFDWSPVAFAACVGAVVAGLILRRRIGRAADAFIVSGLAGALRALRRVRAAGDDLKRRVVEKADKS